MILGKLDTERIQLNEESGWSGASFQRGRKEVYRTLAKVGKLLFGGKHIEAEEIGKEKMLAMRLPIGVHTLSDIRRFASGV
jgi:alpha-L-fucosidase 2